VVRSIAQGPVAPVAPADDPGVSLHDRAALFVGVAVVVVMLVVYGLSNPHRTNFYDHFVWQASAWLDGQAGIRYPVTPAAGLGHSNDLFQDVLVIRDAAGEPTGRALIPFPPFPAVVLLPFVALFGLATDQQAIAAALGALDVGLAFWILGRLPIRPSVRLASTVFFGLGTVFWFSAMEGTTWWFAHVVAVGLTFLAIAVALDADPAAVAWSVADEWEPGAAGADMPTSSAAHSALTTLGHALRSGVDRRQFVAGLLLGTAATARLTMAFGFPFLVLVGGGGSWLRRGISGGLGMAVPIGLLGLYNLVSSGHLFNPAYESIWAIEIRFYPNLAQYSYLQYHLDWGIEDPRYIPQNLWIMLANLPLITPACSAAGAARSLFRPECAWLMPRADGMGLLWTTPAWLLFLPTQRGWGRNRLVSGALLATLLIAVVNLMHFSQGWVQFGYRFSNDFAPFLLLAVALGLQRIGGLRWWAAALIGVSIAVNWWGVVWGVALGW
jgi:hypothetical protein